MARPDDMWQFQIVNCWYVYNPDKGERKEESLRVRDLRTFLKIGSARYAAPEKGCLNRFHK